MAEEKSNTKGKSPMRARADFATMVAQGMDKLSQQAALFEEFIDRYENLKIELQNLKKQLELTSKDNTEKNAALKGLKTANKNLQKTITEQDHIIAAKTAIIKDHKSTIDARDKELRVAKNNYRKLENELLQFASGKKSPPRN